MRLTGSGDPRRKVEGTLTGKLPQRKITTLAAQGYSSYGNQIGLATGMVSEVYDEGFVAKRMEIGAVVGAAPKANVRREAPAAGDIILLVGGRTGRDGCGGATGSSKEHTTESIITCSAEVQKGNAPTERKIQRLFRNPAVSRLIKRCNDFGAGGVSVAVGELAPGLDIDLDAVPKKYEGLDGTELAISESQERMAVVINPTDLAAFERAVAEENLEMAIVARVTGNRRLTMRWRGKIIVNLSRDFIDTNGVLQRADLSVAAPDPAKNFFKTTLPTIPDANGSLRDAWLAMLADLNVCSQKGLAERFDSTIGAASVLLPFGGKYQTTPTQSMVAKLPLINGETTTGTAMSWGFFPRLARWSPFHGAVYAVIDAVARIVAAGGNHRTVRLTLQEYFEKLGVDPVKWGKPFAALLGALYAQEGLGTPAIGGKDSMSGTFHDLSVPPSLAAFALTPIDVSRVISPEFKAAGHTVVLFPFPRNEAQISSTPQCTRPSVTVRLSPRIRSETAALQSASARCVSATKSVSPLQKIMPAPFYSRPTSAPSLPNCATRVMRHVCLAILPVLLSAKPSATRPSKLARPYCRLTKFSSSGSRRSKRSFPPGHRPQNRPWISRLSRSATLSSPEPESQSRAFSSPFSPAPTASTTRRVPLQKPEPSLTPSLSATGRQLISTSHSRLPSRACANRRSSWFRAGSARATNPTAQANLSPPFFITRTSGALSKSFSASATVSFSASATVSRP